MRFLAHHSLWHAVGGGAHQQGIARTLIALAGIALGVALGTAVNIVNHSAKIEFSSAARSLVGTADLSVLATASGFPEDVYARVGRLASVEAASPSIESEAYLPRQGAPLRVIGIDPLRAPRVQPALLANLGPEKFIDLLGGNAVLLSAAAAHWLDARVGDKLEVMAQQGAVPLVVAGILPHESYSQKIAIMDIAAVQWRLGRPGTIHRIDVRARPGADVPSLTAEIGRLLPAGVHVVRPDAATQQMEAASRAYRVNLDMLALVALLTGAVLVFSTQALSLMRRRVHFALLRALGVRRRELLVAILARSALLGAAGSAAGIALGLVAGHFAVTRLGLDLGAGYFTALSPRLHVDYVMLGVYFVLGVTSYLAGTLAPALRAVRAPVATSLRSGDPGNSHDAGTPHALGFVVIGAAALVSQLPPIGGLPVFGYAAVTMLLLGGLILTPWLVRLICRHTPGARSVLASIALGKLAGSPTHVTLSLAAILVSFSLMVSMLIMVHSFRGSLEQWLQEILPADLYARAAAPGRPANLDPATQRTIAQAPGVREVRFARYDSLLLRPDRPPVVLIARDIPQGRPDALPLVAAAQTGVDPKLPAIWITEAVRDLHALRLGERVALALGGRRVDVQVAGIWRDYARQGGAILIARDTYAAITGEHDASDAWIWLDGSKPAETIAQDLRALLPADLSLEFRKPADLRAASLSVFDRTFAITYAIEFVAIVIGIFGISTAFSADVIGRRAELGMLRHIGLTRSQLVRSLALEGALVGACGVLLGAALGWGLSLVLVHVVNRQSFHWSIDLDVPIASLALLGCALVCATAVSAWASGRHALAPHLIRAVREDW